MIVIMTDDQGYGELSCHGNPVVQTPHLDRFASESVRFTDFHVAPMCTPTRGQLMTGIDCLRNGAMNVSSGRTLLRREYPTIAEVLQQSGYRTAQFGKWHLGDNYPFRPHDRGLTKRFGILLHISALPPMFGRMITLMIRIGIAANANVIRVTPPMSSLKKRRSGLRLPPTVQRNRSLSISQPLPRMVRCTCLKHSEMRYAHDCKRPLKRASYQASMPNNPNR